jgi:hypothetical protein
MKNFILSVEFDPAGLSTEFYTVPDPDQGDQAAEGYSPHSPVGHSSSDELPGNDRKEGAVLGKDLRDRNDDSVLFENFGFSFGHSVSEQRRRILKSFVDAFSGKVERLFFG